MKIKLIFGNISKYTSFSILIKSTFIIFSLAILWSCRKKDKTTEPVTSGNEDVFQILSKNSFGSIIYPITSVTPSTNVDDLNSISQFLSNKSIVALGESTHGTSEFYTLRLRMIQHMVTQLNFRVIALETNFSNAQYINDYILGGPGNAKDALQKLYGWVYNNQEFVQIVEWLRGYNDNQSVSNKVTFYGFDAQSAEAAAKRVQTFISAFDPTYLSNYDSIAEPFLNDFQELASIDQDSLIQIIPLKVANYQLRWNTLKLYFQTNKSQLISLSGTTAYELTLRHLEIVQQTFNSFLLASDELQTNNFRDNYMADNVDWIQQFENNKKIILMAHAGHSGMYSDYGITPMGNHLKQRHPNDYFTIGLFTNGGTVRVVNTSIPTPVLGEFKIDPKPEHYLTQAFAQGKWSQFFLPMNAVNQNSELKALFNKPIKFYFIGATTEKVSIEQNLLMGYDAIVFLEKTSATKPN